MADEKSGFHIRYASPRSLQRDHTMHFAHGGTIVPWKAAPPEDGSTLTLRIEAPDGTLFDVKARVVRALGAQGFSVAFEGNDRSIAALDLFIKGDRFRRLVGGEKPGAARAAAVKPFGAMASRYGEMEGDATDPSGSATEALEEPTDATQDRSAGEDGELGDSGGAPEDDTDAGAGLEALLDAADAAGADDEALPVGFKKPGPGDEYVVYVVKFALVREFAALRDQLRATQKLEIEHQEERARKGKVAQLRLNLPGHNIYNMFGIIESVGPTSVVLRFDENNENFRQACLYTESPAARNRMKNEDPAAMQKPQVLRMLEVVPEDDPEKMPIRRRLQRMGMDDKINLALSGGREERMALAMDGNKAVHHYLLRNAKISLDEIAFMARLPTMNPDVLDKIAENPQYTQNPTVVKALIYNPKTPVPTAIRLLDRLPRTEVANLAKRTNMNLRLVMAAKKKIEGKRW